MSLSRRRTTVYIELNGCVDSQHLYHCFLGNCEGLMNFTYPQEQKLEARSIEKNTQVTAHFRLLLVSPKLIEKQLVFIELELKI